jgi:hypothetical protein
MSMWTKLILGAAMVFAVGNGWIYRNARALDVTLVPERRTEHGRLLVEITAERMTIYSKPWDGIGHVGGIVGPIFPSIALESPPDLMLCVVDAKHIRCHADGSKKAPVSYCHDSFRCKWQVDADRRDGFALVVFDLDIFWGRSVSDLVDVVSVPGRRSALIEKRVRSLIEEVAPTRVEVPQSAVKAGKFDWRPGEAQRRKRPLTQAPLGYCDSGCDLEQSAISLNAF